MAHVSRRKRANVSSLFSQRLASATLRRICMKASKRPPRTYPCDLLYSIRTFSVGADGFNWCLQAVIKHPKRLGKLSVRWHRSPWLRPRPAVTPCSNISPTPQAPPGSEGNGAPDAAAEAEVDLSMFDLSKKKKKKKKKVKTEGDDEEGGGDGDNVEEGEGRYNYETLLERIQVCVRVRVRVHGGGVSPVPVLVPVVVSWMLSYVSRMVGVRTRFCCSWFFENTAGGLDGAVLPSLRRGCQLFNLGSCGRRLLIVWFYSSSARLGGRMNLQRSTRRTAIDTTDVYERR